jgi:hypothetical protein
LSWAAVASEAEGTAREILNFFIGFDVLFVGWRTATATGGTSTRSAPPSKLSNMHIFVAVRRRYTRGAGLLLGRSWHTRALTHFGPGPHTPWRAYIVLLVLLVHGPLFQLHPPHSFGLVQGAGHVRPETIAQQPAQGHPTGRGESGLWQPHVPQ